MDVFLRIITLIIFIIFKCIRFVRNLTKSNNDRCKVTSIQNDLLLISATELADKIRRKEILSYDVVAAYIERIKEVDPLLNAVTDERFDDALTEAKEVDRYVSECNDLEKLKKEKPLFGVPITLKESLSVKGMSLTGSSLRRLGMKANEDSDAVAKIRESGAVILLVSKTPEYCCGGETTSLMFGKTNNPYNFSRASCGSSGGEAVLLASAASVIGLGSDLAGSIKLPASANGIFGHLPSDGISSSKGHFPNFKTYTQIGPFARYAQDLDLLMNILVNDKEKYNKNIDFNNLCIHVMVDEAYKQFGLIPVDNQIKYKINLCADLLRKNCNGTITKINFKYWRHVPEILTYALSNLNWDFLPIEDKSLRNVLNELFLSIIGKSKLSWYISTNLLMEKVAKLKSKEFLQKYDNLKDKLRDEIMNALADNGILLFPVFPETSYYHNEFLYIWMSLQYSFIINVLGLPSTTVPVGFDDEGMPFGIQVIGNINQDKLCIEVAKKLEELGSGWISP